MTLPIPFKSQGKVWTEVELAELTGGALADARKAADAGDPYTAILALLAGGISSITAEDSSSETDRHRFKVICRDMPWLSAEVAVMHAFTLSGVSEEIEGAYACPRCGKQVICEGDSADRLSDLAVIPEGLDGKIEHELEHPVTVKNTLNGEVVLEVRSVRLRRATMGDCMKAFQRVGLTDVARYQFCIYGETVQAVSGEEVDQKWRNAWGSRIFERMVSADLKAIAAQERAVGLQTGVEKTCSKCGKHWEVEIEPMSFFASGLRRE